MRRAAAAVAAAWALLLGVWAVALAHAALLAAEPAAGSRLAASPSRVRLVFSEPVEPALARLALAGRGPATPLAAAGDPRDVYALVAPVGPLAPGAYRVLWRVVSADGHPVEGSVDFSVGASGAPTSGAPASGAVPLGAAAPASSFGGDTAAASWGPAVAGAPLVPAALRGLALGSLMALAGVLGFVVLPRGAGARSDARTGAAPRRRARLGNALAAAVPLLLGLHLAAWLLNIAPDHRLSADWIATALSTTVGRVELWRVGLGVLALWAVGLARRPGLGLLFAAGALVVSGATGHAAAIQPYWAAPAKALHLLAAAAWLGGVLWLLARGRDDAGAFARDAARVSAVALAATLVVALTGVVETFLFLPAPLDVFRSAYGAVVLLKVAGLLVLVAFGAYYRTRVLARLARDPAGPARFGALLRRELAVMGAVVLLGGLLAYVPPPARVGASAPSVRPPVP